MVRVESKNGNGSQVWWLKLIILLATGRPRSTGIMVQVKTSLDKKFLRPHLNQSKLGIEARVCHPSYVGSINGRITVQVSLSKSPYDSI
jgi:hypothetical protein